MHQSVATIDSPQFLNLQPLDINPLMSKCEIKVLYVGSNRNHTFIDEQVAAEIGKTLRGAPIVGYYRDSKEDFTDHGEKVIIDDEGIKFQCQTVPYGFVSPDADVWFQNFEDFDEMGNSAIHKYLMTTGFLWTGQFAESNLPVAEGRPQSMEFEKDSVKGHWETNIETGMDFFIINDAVIQKICILGDDVEPCFEGASVTAPKVSSNYTLDNNFKHTLYSMMKDLKFALEKGGQQTMGNLETPVVEDVATSEVEIEVPVVNEVEAPTESATEYKKDDEETEEEKESESNDSEPIDKEEDKKDVDKEKEAKNYALLEAELQTLKDSYSALQAQCQELISFKTEVENHQKDQLISEFFMLSDEDKADVIANKEKYTLDEIKAKLSVICFDKKINFTLGEKSEEVASSTEVGVTTYNLNSTQEKNLPDWVKAVKEQQELG